MLAYQRSFVLTNPNISLLTYVVLAEFSQGFAQLMCILLVLTNFQIAVQKEIELSKSGTSSTSSMSSSKASSKASSSSSSNSADPVIEL